MNRLNDCAARRRGRLCLSGALVPLPVPAALFKLTEDHHVAAVLEHQLEVAPPQRLTRPPAVLDQPLFPHRAHRQPSDGARPAVGANLDRDRPGLVEAAWLHARVLRSLTAPPPDKASARHAARAPEIRDLPRAPAAPHRSRPPPAPGAPPPRSVAGAAPREPRAPAARRPPPPAPPPPAAGWRPAREAAPAVGGGPRRSDRARLLPAAARPGAASRHRRRGARRCEAPAAP